VLEGDDQNARRRPEAGGGKKRDPRDRGHDPGVVEALHLNPKRELRHLLFREITISRSYPSADRAFVPRA